MTRPQAAAVVIGLVAIFGVGLLAGIGAGGSTLLEERAEGSRRAEDARRMSSDFLDSNLATGLVGIIGVLLGVVVEWVLRRRGKLRAKLDRANASYSGRMPEYPDTTTRIVIGTPEQLDATYDWNLHYDFRVGFYNEKDTDAGLMDIGGAIIDPDGRDYIPLRAQVRGADNTLNLPSHQWTYFGLEAADTITEDKIERAKQCNRVQIRAKWPNGRPYKSEILEFEIETYFLADPEYFGRE